jgi:hypothetical protein
MFARKVARHSNLAAAFREAGYSPCSSGASRLAKRPEVKARIKVLREIEAAHVRAGRAATILRLMAIAESPKAMSSAATMREARVAQLEAHRLSLEVDEIRRRQENREPLPRRELTDEEWMEIFGTKSDGSVPIVGPDDPRLQR